MCSERHPSAPATCHRVFAAALFVACSATALAAPTVAVIKSGPFAPFDRATRKIVTTLRQSPVKPEILTFDLEDDQANAGAVLARVRGANPDVIMPVGSLATESALAGSSTAPIVFSMVLYPEESGYLRGHRQRLTGASLDIPPDVQFTYVRRLLPAVRRIGVLFDPGETGAVVESARGAASKQGLTLVAKPVNEGDDVIAALRKLMAEVDVIWTVADSRVITTETTPALILASLRQRMPLIGLSVAHVRAGALAALYCDYEDVGEQAATLALRILQGEPPASLPVTHPRRVGLALNLRTAEHLGLNVPPDVASEAGETMR
jgi:putative ABC transport system substrate-binding protein